MKKGKSLKDFFVVGVGTVLYMLVGFLTTPVITRLVDPTEYGQLSLFISYGEIAMMVLMLGLDQALVRFFYRQDDILYKRKLLFLCWRLPLALWAAVGLLSIGAVFAFDIEIGESILLPFVFVFYVGTLLIHRLAILVVRLQYKSVTYSALNIFQKLIYIALALLFVLFIPFGSDFLILAVATTASFFAVSLVAIILERRLWDCRVPDTCLPFPEKELYIYGVPLIFSSAMAVLLHSCDKIVLNWYCDYAAVGLYASAVNLANLFAIIQTTFNTVWAPMMVEHYEKEPEDRKFYTEANSIITVILFFFGATVLLGKDIVALLLGEKYRAAALIMPFLLFYPIMYTASETTNCGIVFMKKTYYNIAVSLAALVVDLVGNILLIPLMGPVGAALSTALAYIVFYAMRTLLSRSLFRVEYQLGRFAIVTVLMLIFCAYSAYHTFDIVILAMYAVFTAVLAVLYKNTFKLIVSTGLGFAKKLIGKVIGSEGE